MKNIVRAIVLIALFSVLFASTAAARGHHGGGAAGRGMGGGGRGIGGGMDGMGGMGMRTGQA
jgi:hypothetical protein